MSCLIESLLPFASHGFSASYSTTTIGISVCVTAAVCGVSAYSADNETLSNEKNSTGCYDCVTAGDSVANISFCGHQGVTQGGLNFAIEFTCSGDHLA
jgi:hypothetical protein